MSPECDVWPPELHEQKQWMGRAGKSGKQPFAPWVDRDHPEADPDEDARWKWGLTENYVNGDTIAIVEDDPRLEGRVFLQRVGDPYGFVDGFLEGIIAEIILRALDGDAPPTGVFITPSHPPGPDLETALLLLDEVQNVCEFTVDKRELRESAEQMKQYYTELASRMETLTQGEQPIGSRDYPEDSMFM